MVIVAVFLNRCIWDMLSHFPMCSCIFTLCSVVVDFKSLLLGGSSSRTSLDFGRPANVACQFSSKFSDLKVHWDNLTIPSAHVSPKGSTSVAFDIDIFRPEHERNVTCVGSVTEGSTSRTFNLRGMSSSHSAGVVRQDIRIFCVHMPACTMIVLRGHYVFEE